MELTGHQPYGPNLKQSKTTVREFNMIEITGPDTVLLKQNVHTGIHVCY